LWKDSRRSRSEEQRAQRLVLDEIETNIALLGEVRERLVDDNEAAKTNREVIAPPPQIPTESWRTVRLAGTLSSADDLAKEIGLTYHRLDILNQRIQAREMFRATNKALTGYNVARTSINNVLMKSVDDVLPRLESHRTALRKAER